MLWPILEPRKPRGRQGVLDLGGLGDHRPAPLEAAQLTPVLSVASLLGMKLTEPLSDELFREQCRRQMDRPLTDRLRYGFCRVYKPVLDDVPWRAFNSMAEYPDPRRVLAIYHL
jgi:hypothetical protein